MTAASTHSTAHASSSTPPHSADDMLPANASQRDPAAPQQHEQPRDSVLARAKAKALRYIDYDPLVVEAASVSETLKRAVAGDPRRGALAYMGRLFPFVRVRDIPLSDYCSARRTGETASDETDLPLLLVLAVAPALQRQVARRRPHRGHHSRHGSRSSSHGAFLPLPRARARAQADSLPLLAVLRQDRHAPARVRPVLVLRRRLCVRSLRHVQRRHDRARRRHVARGRPSDPARPGLGGRRDLQRARDRDVPRLPVRPHRARHRSPAPRLADRGALPFARLGLPKSRPAD